MSKLVRVEDIVKVVGMKNYIASLEMEERQMVMKEYRYNEKNQAVIEFQYQGGIPTFTHITIDKKRNIKSISCDCHRFNHDEFCPHTALAIRYLFANETLVNHIVRVLNNQKDDLFNQLLFQTMEDEEQKIPVRLELILRQSERYEPYVYEVYLKIGDTKLYQLNRKLEEFLNHYQDKDAEITFGKHFTYRTSVYRIKKEDEVLLQFFKMLLERYQERKHFGYHSSQIETIKISGESLSYLLSLLKNRPFQMDRMGIYTYFDGVSDTLDFPIRLSEEENQIRLDISYENLEPITEDYEYITYQGMCYHVSKKERQLLKLFVEHNKETIFFKEKEWPVFTETVLPHVLKLNTNPNISKELKSKLVIENWKPKLYFEKEDNEIVAHLHLKSENVEFDIFNKEQNKLYVYDKKMVSEIVEELKTYGFQKKKTSLVLKDEIQIIHFIESGMYQIGERYDIRIDTSLKKIKVNRNTSVESTFHIGKDRILNYEFSLDGISENDFLPILQGLKKKKKYIKLESGDYLDLEQETFREFDTLYQTLSFSDTTMKGKLPIYECVRLLEVGQHHIGSVSLDDSIENYMREFQNYKKMKIEFSKDEDVLREYQKIGVKWMLMIASLGFGGILADEMGLGKSLQTIVYIKHRLKEDPTRKFLIVVPTALVYNWKNEWDKFAPDIRYEIIHDTKEKRKQKLSHIQDVDVMITSYGTLRNDMEDYEEILFDTCFIDEAQAIKNVRAETTQAVRRIRANTKFALTGTPIENSIFELWSIFDYMMPGFLGTLKQFKETYQIKNDRYEKEDLEQLQKLVSPFILRRKKSDVLKDLPPKIENHLYVELNEFQKQIYIATLEDTRKKIDEVLKEGSFSKNQVLILSLLTKLRQICIDPRLLYDEESIGSKIIEVVNLVEQIKENGHKILLFSQFPSALKLLKPELEKRNIAYSYLDGQTKSKERIKLVESFNQNEDTVFLISLKAGGTGLNLTSADVVIHLDPWWNPQVENQATDRSHRIGQKNVVEVIKLITKGTIEERIIELQQKKKELSDQMIDHDRSGEFTLSKLSEKELMSILEGNL